MPYASERLQAQVSLPNRWQKERGEARHRLTEHQHGHETRQHKMEPSRKWDGRAPVSRLPRLGKLAIMGTVRVGVAGLRSNAV